MKSVNHDTLCIAPATTDDIDALVQLEMKTFTSDQISRRQFRYLLGKESANISKITCDNELFGYIILLTRKDSRKMRIYSLGIVSELRKMGLGSKLLAFAESEAIKAGSSHLILEVCEKNTAAIALYEARGFTQTARIEGYYQDGCTALKLTKKIPEGIYQ